jgi:hypothetical protein
MVDQQHAPAALAGLRRAHHPGGAGADDDDVVGLHAGTLTFTAAASIVADARARDPRQVAGPGAAC